ncbi:hypothetical protein [Herbidospora yilanensis]|uniref:hypothetical protein n=1 Tax=Herbidospora yilanensis TaxID=354426 RepID=UPI000785C02A|nr:hypothetical protein [Herbidospora yilanensis]
MRAIGYTVAWCGATALAVGVAWFGVSGVLRTALGDGEPLTPLVVAAPNLVSGVQREPPPAPDEKAAPPPAPSTTPTPAPRPRKKPTASSRPTPTRKSPVPSPAAAERLHTFTLKGGRATVAVGEGDCRIVSATPAEGWELKTWTEPYWLRVTFLKDGRESSAFCTWNTLPPRLDTYET